MIVYAMAVVALLLGALPAAGRRWLRALHPAVATKAVMVSLLGTVVMTELTLVSLGAPVVLRAGGAHGLARRCSRMASDLLVGSPWVGWPAAAAALLLPGLAFAGYQRARAAQATMHEVALLGRPSTLVGHQVVVVDSTRPLAVSVAAHGGVVVVSSALVDQLSDEELAAVLRHERSHLDHRHHMMLRIASAGELGLGFLPWIRSAVDQMRCSIERWADEDAAGSAPETRKSTRRALVEVATAGLSVDVAAFGGLATVVERVEALEGPAAVHTRTHTALAFAPLAALSTGALFSAVVVVANFWLVLTMSHICSA